MPKQRTKLSRNIPPYDSTGFTEDKMSAYYRVQARNLEFKVADGAVQVIGDIILTKFVYRPRKHRPGGAPFVSARLWTLNTGKRGVGKLRLDGPLQQLVDGVQNAGLAQDLLIQASDLRHVLIPAQHAARIGAEVIRVQTLARHLSVAA